MVEVSKICLSNPQKTGSFIKIQHFFPSAFQKKLLGEILFLIEIKLPNDSIKKYLDLAEEITKIIINGFKTYYYSEESLKGKEIEEIFENSLQKLNRLIYQEIIGSKFFKILIKNLSAVISLIREDEIYFSPVGSVKVFILKKKRMIDLISQEITFTPEKIFSQIISGKLEENDVLFFSTENFLDYFTSEKLNSIVSKLSADESIKEISHLLENLKDKISLGAFLIKKELEISKEIPKREIVEIKKAPVKIKITPEKEKVEEILVKEKISEPVVEKKQEEILISKKPIVKKKISLGFIPKIFKTISLPRLNLNIFLVAVLVIFLILSLISGKIREKELTKFFLTFQEIQAKNAILEASLASKDLKKANALAEEIQNKIGQIQAKTKIEKEILENFKKNFQENIDKIYGLVRIKEPKIIVDFSSLDKNGEIINLIKINEDFLVFNKRTKEIYGFNQKKDKISSLAKIDLPIFQKMINYSLDEILLATQNKIQLFNLKNKKIFSIKLETSEKNFFISDLKIYDGKLYILNQKTNQILKYLPLESGFGQENLWLKEKIDLKSIVSFAIDGSIYLLKDSGQLTKFFRGKKQSFNLENIYPPLNKPIKVETNEKMRNIYILEPINKRVLIFNKTGYFIKQITSDKFSELKDFLVDERETKIWLLDGNKIVEINL